MNKWDSSSLNFLLIDAYDILIRMELKLPLLIYDTQCPMCLRFKQGLERWDVEKRVCYVPLDNDELFTLYPQLNREACTAQVHYLREDGAILIGGEVVTELIKHFPGVGKLAWLLETDIGKKTADFFYKQIDTVRQKMKAEEESCGTCRKP
jgi:predicted DCC family thiol-disulfide oxidoreductase YuxK